MVVQAYKLMLEYSYKLIYRYIDYENGFALPRAYSFISGDILHANKTCADI